MAISPVFVRFAEVGAFASAFWRVLLALPLLALWMLIEAREPGRNLRETLRIDKPIVLAGIFFAGDLFFWHLSILQTTVANATLLACLAPVWVLLFSGWFIGEAVPKMAFVGLALCLIGATMLIGTSYSLAPEHIWGDLYGLVTSLFFGLYFLTIRVARRTQGAGAVIFKSTLITAIVLLIVVIISGQDLVPQTMTGVSALVALGLISHSGGQGLLAVALGSLSAVFSSLVIFIEAVAAALFAWLLLSESLTLFQLLGGALILVGIWVARPQNETR